LASPLSGGLRYVSWKSHPILPTRAVRIDLSDFVSALPQQGHVLSTAQSSEDTGPVEATDVEAAMLQQAIEASQTSQVSQDDELERAIAASIEDALHSPMTGSPTYASDEEVMVQIAMEQSLQIA